MNATVDKRRNHIMAVTFTPTEQRLLDTLADGKPHGRDALMSLIDDDLASVDALHVHLHRLRNKLALKRDRRVIVCHTVRRGHGAESFFQLVAMAVYKRRP